MIGGALFLLVVVVLYDWAPSQEWPVYFFFYSCCLLGFVMIMIMVPVILYIVDTFGVYFASVMIAVFITRNLGYTLLPMGIPPLIEAVGLGYGFVLLGAVCLCLIPLPVVSMCYSASWRQKSVYTRTD